MVILPALFLPPLLFIGLSRDFSGLLSEPAERSALEVISLKRCPGVVGLYFLIAIIPSI
jgi:hypothetical protein